MSVLSEPYRILVKEKIADSGVALLRERFDVDLGLDWDDAQLAERIGAYHGILIRSATKLTADLISRGDKLKVIGRAGVGDLLLDEDPVRLGERAHAAAGTPASRNTFCAAPGPAP